MRFGLAALLVVSACRQKPNDDGLLSIPAGEFAMGCQKQRDPSCGGDEVPQRRVSIAAFRLERTEVTQAAYAKCVSAGACTSPAGKFEPASAPARPVTQVSWAQATQYCAWRGWRLPTEAEWEWAARGADGRTYPWGDEAPSCARAHTNDCGAEPVDTGTLPAGASPFGVMELAGNVDEWVDDLYAPYDADAGTSGQRVARGGAYDAWHIRSTARMAMSPQTHDAWLGFRCAATAR